MSNKARNVEAVRINRPIVTGQANSVVEAWVAGVVDIIFGVNLLPPMRDGQMWRKNAKRN